MIAIPQNWVFAYFILVFSACDHTPAQPQGNKLPELAGTSSITEIVDLSIPKQLPLCSGTWKGIGPDKGRMFLWTLDRNNLEGTYLSKRRVTEDYSKVFKFGVEKGVICCYPVCYQCDCGTPSGTYRLTAQTDSSYTFVSDERPVVKSHSTLKFSFLAPKQMEFLWEHHYEDKDYPDYQVIRRFQQSL